MRDHKYARLKAVAGGLGFWSSYDPALVAELKAKIPHSDRRWSQNDKAWIVAPRHAQTLKAIVWKYLDLPLDIPKAEIAAKTAKLLKLEYLGAVKDRDGGEQTAFGWCDGDWSLVFPLSVLQAWFCVDSKPGESKSLFGILGLAQTAQDDEIKAAYRRLARQWHPDVCKEPDAQEQFLAIKRAYDVLSDNQQRARYMAGLQLTQSSKSVNNQMAYSRIDSYRAPLRCGWVLAEGIDQIGRFVVSRILQWEDISNSRGQIMVTSWPFGAKKFKTDWV